MGTNLIAETNHIVFLPGHGPGVMIYVPDQLFHFSRYHSLVFLSW